MSNNKYWQIATHDREADLLIYGDITSWQWEESDVTAHGLASEIKDLDVDTLNVHIDSYGGEVSEGWAIYNALKQHPAKVRTYADGFVASAANYPFLAGDERIANNVSAFFLHQVLTGAWGNADDLRKAADEADKLNEIGINAFANAGMDADKVRELMKEETWLTGEEAVELGLATQVVTSDASEHPAQSVRQTILAKLFAKQEAVEEPAEEPEPEQEPEQEIPAEEPETTITGTIINSMK